MTVLTSVASASYFDTLPAPKITVCLVHGGQMYILSLNTNQPEEEKNIMRLCFLNSGPESFAGATSPAGEGIW
jgi:hypothetical protein